jgi:Uma2 family endonuclease
MLQVERLSLGKNDAGRLLTRIQFAHALFDQHWRYERVKRQLRIVAPPENDRAVAQAQVTQRFMLFHRHNPSVVSHVYDAAWIAVGRDTDRIAGVGVYLHVPGRRIQVPTAVPELICDVVGTGIGTSFADYESKLDDYLRAGVCEYLIVDPYAHLATFLRRLRNQFSVVQLGPTEVFKTRLLPGLRISLAEIL